MKRTVVVPVVVAVAAALGVAAGAVSRDLVAGDAPGDSPREDETSAPGPTADPRLGQPLYWADDVIHDGDLEVPYRTEFSIDRLARTAHGYAVLDTDATGWLQLADESGRSVPVQHADLTNDFDVSADGQEIVFPGPEENEITVASTEDGESLLTLDADLTVDLVRFAGDSFVVGGRDRGDDVIGQIHVVDRAEQVVEVRPGAQTTPFWRLAGMHEATGLILATRGTDRGFPRISERGELIAFDIADPTRPLWRVADQSLLDAGPPSIDTEPGLVTSDPDAISPDGALVATVPYTGFLFQPEVTVLDAGTGEAVGEESLRRNGADSLAWSDDETLMFSEILPDRDPARFQVAVCPRDVDCDRIAGPYESVQLGTSG